MHIKKFFLSFFPLKSVPYCCFKGESISYTPFILLQLQWLQQNLHICLVFQQVNEVLSISNDGPLVFVSLFPIGERKVRYDYCFLYEPVFPSVSMKIFFLIIRQRFMKTPCENYDWWLQKLSHFPVLYTNTTDG